MTTPPRWTKVSDQFFASQQITAGDMAAIKEAGVTLIVNNRPDGEAPDQPAGAEIEAAARAAGLDYAAVPVGAAGVSAEDLETFEAAFSAASGATLGYCLSGLRSLMVYAFARARAGTSVDALIADAAAAGYDIERFRPTLASLAPDGS
ncbi:MAG: TIGR01244 family sulfur transferase [Pseudomonadota bacterium]